MQWATPRPEDDIFLAYEHTLKISIEMFEVNTNSVPIITSAALVQAALGEIFFIMGGDQCAIPVFIVQKDFFQWSFQHTALIARGTKSRVLLGKEKFKSAKATGGGIKRWKVRSLKALGSLEISRRNLHGEEAIDV